MTLFGPVAVAGRALRDNPVYVAPSLQVSARQLSALRTIVASSDGAMCAVELPDDAAVRAAGTPDQLADTLDDYDAGPETVPYSCVVLVGNRLGASSAFIPWAVSDGYARAAEARFPKDPQAALAALAASVQRAAAPGSTAAASADASLASGAASTTTAAPVANGADQVTPGIDGGPLSGTDIDIITIFALVMALLVLIPAIAGHRTRGTPSRIRQPPQPDRTPDPAPDTGTDTGTDTDSDGPA
ncbi:hypothetical protein [Streptacidiphilus sp. P02-A3a]|uniref:hypothetical protein n=1 Tax=Streptacidiphilus sp. P02-A3a TaxID=2704468 RepID=UPI0015F83165|nr:hypothetical protein [Streptacidiphilus sp. P02-A3a]QMU73204.1 hypothetical protein GXP74_38210 [Streptacidiphilus sp. P02-A3a]